jgi:hypothetical protein
MKRLLLLGTMVAALLPMSAYAHGRFGVVVRPSFGYYGGWYGPGFYPYGYAPYGYGYGPYFGYSHPNTGQVKLDTKVKDAEVFVNGNYSGTTKELKTMNLKPGDYNLEIRVEGREAFRQDIHVLAGKTMTLHPDLTSVPQQAPAESE